MPPLFACFPVCLTFVALGVLALLVFVTGMVGAGPGASASDRPIPEPEYELTGPPRWWVTALIFIAVGIIFFLLNWAGADW
jgi:hypothetical protein